MTKGLEILEFSVMNFSPFIMNIRLGFPINTEKLRVDNLTKTEKVGYLSVNVCAPQSD